MDVIIFDKSGDSDPTGVGIISPSPSWKGTLDELAAEVLQGQSYEIVDNSTLPKDKPRELWVWE